MHLQASSSRSSSTPAAEDPDPDEDASISGKAFARCRENGMQGQGVETADAGGQERTRCVNGEAKIVVSSAGC